MKAIEPLPCPCDTEDQIAIDVHDNKRRVRCLVCGRHTRWTRSRRQAVSLWNAGAVRE